MTRAAEIGEAALPALRDLMAHEPPAIRELALECAAAVGGPDAERLIVRGLLDGDESVRIAAYQALHRHGAHRETLPDLLATFDASADPRVRAVVARVVGRTPGAEPGELRRRLRSEEDANVRDACTVALAKLGDPDARTEFLLALAGTAPGAAGELCPAERRNRLEDAEYIDSDWLLPAMLPLLDDASAAVRIGPVAPGIAEGSLRVCDVAVNLVASAGGAGFSFPVDRKSNYTAAQIDEVRRRLLSIRR